MEEEIRKLKDKVARLTEQLKDQKEINQFLRKINGELHDGRCKCGEKDEEEWWKKIKDPKF